MEETAVLVSLAESGADDARLDTLTRQLRDEVRRLDVSDVRAVPAGTPAPPGSRGLDVAAIGQFVVALVGTQGLAGVVTAMVAWLKRGDDAPRQVRLEVGGDVLELSGASSEEQDRLVAMFLSRHAEKD
ncbi:hypothetical protein GCM10023168_18050 [Fodinibacter luteus]|uniref:Uncharacterized protein n=1 Tax=Fodinibacter luteus TaxID=552064 RepID=A0ABP8KDV4_9MICO